MHEDLRPIGRARNPATSTNADDYRAIAKLVMTARKARSKLFPRSMFSEPAWDILLLLYRDEEASLADLARSADTPRSTAGRWIDFLEADGLVSRDRCGEDRGADRIRITGKAREGLQGFFSALAGNWPIAAAND